MWSSDHSENYRQDGYFTRGVKITFDREYFESDNQLIGYRGVGFRDFSVHFMAVDRILTLSPTSVLEIGGARGYVAKKLIARGIPTIVMERSDHCYHTRAVDTFVQHDIEIPPYPFKDKQFDLVFSDSVLEHLHYEHIDDAIKEITRVSKRSLHGVPITDSGQSREEFMGDSTHIIFESREWWKERFAKADPTHVLEISGNIAGDANYQANIPVVSVDGTDLVKLNVGSSINMFYYGWTNTDIVDFSQFAHRERCIFNQHDATTRFPANDEYVNLIFTSHVIEHFTLQESMDFLKECFRMLCKGGHIRIAVLDTEMLMKRCINRELDFLKHIDPGAEKLVCNLDKFHEVTAVRRKQMYDVCNLTHLLKSTGFKDIKQSDPFHSRSDIMEKETIVSYPTISLVMEATKQ